MTSDAANGGGYAAGDGRHAAIVLSRIGGAVQRLAERQVALAACATWPIASRLLSARCPIDLRSDTVTRPTPAMREAMATARVGDDVYGEDETVNALERRAAELCGREAAVFVPSGTMANQIGIALWAGQGDEVYAHRDAHILIDEAGGVGGALGRASARAAQHGLRARLEELLDAVPMDASDIHRPRARLLCIENTHTGSGGRAWRAETLARVTERAHELGLKVHMDGARLANAAVARGCTLAEASAGADSVSFCFSKGLGAPVGSILVSSAEAIARGRRLRKLLGGGMRQAGVLAAAGLYALDHNVERLAEDHARARALAVALDDDRARLRRPRRGRDEHRAGAPAARRAGAGPRRRAGRRRACCAARSTAARCAS